MERNTIFYIRNLDTNEREFISGEVVGGGLDSVVIEFSHELDLAEGEEVALYYKHQRQFLTRTYKVLRSSIDASGCRAKMQPLGDDPVSGDMRASERIPTIAESMRARFAEEEDCVVIDVSSSGLAVIAGEKHERGDVLRLEMSLPELHCCGAVTVCSAIEVREGRYRYGLKCNPDGAGDNLQTSLPDLWVALQIKYLEHLTA